MNKRQSLLMIRGNLSCCFRLYFCVYLLSFASVRLLYLRVAQILYSMDVLCFHNLLLKFSLNMFKFNTAFGIHSVATSIVRDDQFSTIHCVYLALFLDCPFF